MGVIVIVLVVTNLITLGLAVLISRRSRRQAGPAEDYLDAALAADARTAAPAASPGRARRLISIEILNPIELAGARHRMFGIAGSLAPDLTRRIVYDQTVKILRRQLLTHQVVAELRIHTLPSRGENDDAPLTDQLPV